MPAKRSRFQVTRERGLADAIDDEVSAGDYWSGAWFHQQSPAEYKE
jgi:hypothetical protein